MIKHEATSCDINSKDNTDEDGANKWIPMKIDLFKDFEHLHLTEMKEWATRYHLGCQRCCDFSDKRQAEPRIHSQSFL